MAQTLRPDRSEGRVDQVLRVLPVVLGQIRPADAPDSGAGVCPDTGEDSSIGDR